MLSSLIGITPLALTAARKSERMLVKRFDVIPTAAGLTEARQA